MADYDSRSDSVVHVGGSRESHSVKDSTRELPDVLSQLIQSASKSNTKGKDTLSHTAFTFRILELCSIDPHARWTTSVSILSHSFFFPSTQKPRFCPLPNFVLKRLLAVDLRLASATDLRFFVPLTSRFNDTLARKLWNEYQTHGLETAHNRAWLEEALGIDAAALTQGYFAIWREALENYIALITTILDATHIIRVGLAEATARLVSFMDGHNAGTSSPTTGPLLAEVAVQFSDEIINAIFSVVSAPTHRRPVPPSALFAGVPRLTLTGGPAVILQLVSDARIQALVSTALPSGQGARTETRPRLPNPKDRGAAPGPRLSPVQNPPAGAGNADPRSKFCCFKFCSTDGCPEHPCIYQHRAPNNEKEFHSLVNFLSRGQLTMSPETKRRTSRFNRTEARPQV